MTKHSRYPSACSLCSPVGCHTWPHELSKNVQTELSPSENCYTPAIIHLSGGIPDGEKLAPPFISPQASIGTLFEFSLPLRRLTARLSVRVDLLVCFTHLSFSSLFLFFPCFSQFWGKVHPHPRDISYHIISYHITIQNEILYSVLRVLIALG